MLRALIIIIYFSFFISKTEMENGIQFQQSS